MKAYETPEEKRARRLAKKNLKEKRRKQDMGWDNETLVFHLYFILANSQLFQQVSAKYRFICLHRVMLSLIFTHVLAVCSSLIE